MQSTRCSGTHLSATHDQKLWIGGIGKAVYPWGNYTPRKARSRRRDTPTYKITTDHVEGQAPEIMQSVDELAMEGACQTANDCTTSSLVRTVGTGLDPLARRAALGRSRSFLSGSRHEGLLLG